MASVSCSGTAASWAKVLRGNSEPSELLSLLHCWWGEAPQVLVQLSKEDFCFLISHKEAFLHAPAEGTAARARKENLNFSAFLL